MYDPFASLLLSQAWEIVSVLSLCAEEYVERGEPEAERCYILALVLCEQWFPTTHLYTHVLQGFTAYLRDEECEDEVRHWLTLAAQARLAAQPRVASLYATQWNLRPPTDTERAQMSETERILYALGVVPRAARTVASLLREARHPADELRRYLCEGFAPAECYAFLHASPTLAVHRIDYEAVVAIALLREQMNDVADDLKLALATSVPSRDPRLTNAPDRRAVSMTSYLTTVIADLLSILQQEEVEQQADAVTRDADDQGKASEARPETMPQSAAQQRSEERRDGIRMGKTALRLATRVGAAPFEPMESKPVTVSGPPSEQQHRPLPDSEATTEPHE